VPEGESVGEAAARIMQTQRASIAALMDPNPGSSDVTCDSCAYLKTAGLHARLCQNEEAVRRGFAKRGYPVPAGHGCELHS
jgi:hypothetical protein